MSLRALRGISTDSVTKALRAAGPGLAALVAVLAASGCSGGVIGDPASGHPGVGGPGATTPGSAPVDPTGLLGGSSPPPAAYVPAPATLRRLTVLQYQNSLR